MLLHYAFMVLPLSDSIGTTDNGSTIEAATIVYISPDTDNFFLSKDVMIQLEIVGKDFPRIGSAHAIEDVGPKELNHVCLTLN